jgi:hypothetical protein
VKIRGMDIEVKIHVVDEDIEEVYEMLTPLPGQPWPSVDIERLVRGRFSVCHVDVEKTGWLSVLTFRARKEIS